jgi:hypothetical protein
VRRKRIPAHVRILRAFVRGKGVTLDAEAVRELAAYQETIKAAMTGVHNACIESGDDDCVGNCTPHNCPRVTGSFWECGSTQTVKDA